VQTSPQGGPGEESSFKELPASESPSRSPSGLGWPLRGPNKVDPPHATIFPLFVIVYIQPIILPLVGLLLIANGRADDRFVSPNRTHTRALGPDMEPGKVALPAKIIPVNPDRRLPFEPPDRIGHAVFRRHAQA
jgi:hypothetical protein